MDSSYEDSQREDDVQPQIRNQQNQQLKRPYYTNTVKEPPIPNKFLTKQDKNSEVMNISSFIDTGKMFKTLGDENIKEKYELAREAKEKYKKQVQKFKGTHLDPKPTKTSEKMEAPVAPTPFLMFCTRRKKKSIAWCVDKFPSLPDKEKLKWIDIALAEEASYLEKFEKFKAENPNLKPKLMPVLNEEEKLLVYMRCLVSSEYPSIPSKKDGTLTEMAQWTASWNSLNKEQKKVYQETVIAIKHEFNVKLSAYLSNLPFENGEQETTNRLPDAKGTKRKKGAETDSSAPLKKSKTLFWKENDPYSSEEESSSTLSNVGCKEKATKAKEPDNKSSSSAVDSSAASDISDDITLPKKKLIIAESSDESDSEPEQSNPQNKTVSMLGASVSSKKAKFGSGNSSPQLDTNGSDPSSASSSDDEPQKMRRASSSSFKSGKKMSPSVTERSIIHKEGDSSEEDGSDSSDGEFSSIASSSKLKNIITVKGKTPSTTVDSSNLSDFDNTKKIPTGKCQREIASHPINAGHMKRKKRAETDDSSSSSAKKSKPAFSDHNDSNTSEEEEKSSTLPIVGRKKKATKVKESGNKSSTVDSSNESEDSDDVILPKKKLISPPKSVESSKESSEESDSELEKPNLPKKSVSMLASTESSASSAKKSKPAFSDHNDSDSSEEEEPLTLPIIRSKTKVAKVKESGNKSASVTVNSNDESENSDDVTSPKKKLISPPKSAESSEESSEESDSELAQPNLSKKKVSMVASTESNYLTLAKKAECGIGNPSPQPGTNGSYPSSSTASDDESQKLKRSSSSSSKSGKSVAPVRSAIQSEENSSDEDESDSSDEEESNGPKDLSPSMVYGFKTKNEKSNLNGLPKTSDAVDTSDEVDSDDIGSENPLNKKQVTPKSAEKSGDESSTSSSDNDLQETNRSSSSSFKIGKSIAPSKPVLSAIQCEEDTSGEEDSDSSDEEEESNKKSSGEETDESSASSKQSKSFNIEKYPSNKEEISTLPTVKNSRVDEYSGDITLLKKEPTSPTSAEKSSEASSKEIGSEEELSMINTNSSTIGNDSSSSVRPLWALKQRLFQNEPPKPPKTAAEWHAFEICQVPNIPDKKRKELWNGLSEKKRKMLKIEHSKRLQEYEEKLQAFKNGLSKTELQAYINIKRSQRVVSDDESN